MDPWALGSIAKSAKIAKDRRKLNVLAQADFSFGVFGNFGDFGNFDSR